MEQDFGEPLEQDFGGNTWSMTSEESLMESWNKTSEEDLEQDFGENAWSKTSGGNTWSKTSGETLREKT